jgi:hypothetical protein
MYTQVEPNGEVSVFLIEKEEETGMKDNCITCPVVTVCPLLNALHDSIVVMAVEFAVVTDCPLKTLIDSEVLMMNGTV